MEPIPCLDLKKQYLSIKEEIVQSLIKVCDDTAFSGGKYVEKFEHEFADYCGTNYCVALNNGTSALQLAMLALRVGPGDEVLVPANTFIATAWGVSYAGATPVFVDCDSQTWEVDMADLEKKITQRTKAIAGVHLYGQPFNVNAVKKIASEHGIPFIEDSAQAHGAKFDGVRVGSFGSMACFSFYPGKNLGTYGEGGCITTNNEEYYKHLLSLRNHGSTVRYYHDEIGYNMRMGGLEAAVLSVKLKYLDQWNSRRREIAAYYQEGIKNELIEIQQQAPQTESVYHLFVVTTKNRDALLKHLHANQIFPGLHYPVPCHLQKAYANLNYKKGDLPHSEYLSDHCLSLPMYAELSSEETAKVVSVINSYR
jgi:dTDP-4-amino-4,6-dideoxygalactose transaminase